MCRYQTNRTGVLVMAVIAVACAIAVGKPDDGDVRRTLVDAGHRTLSTLAAASRGRAP